MKDTVVLTAIYEEFWGTQHFRKSVNRVGLEVYNVFPPGAPYQGNGIIYQYFYDAFLKFRDQYKTVIYSDGADTVFQKAFIPPTDRIIYSVEKAIWPPLPHLGELYKIYYDRPRFVNIQHLPWKYLNGGNWCGPIDLFIEWYDRYRFHDLRGAVNGQREQWEGFFKADANGFPIEFDHQCEYFQTTAFEHEGDFRLAEDGKSLINNLTGTTPCVLHGNGRTEMGPIYERWS